MVGDVVDAVVGHVYDLDAALARRRDVDVVIAGPAAREHAHAVQPRDRLPGETGVVDEDGVGALRRGHDLLRLVPR